MEPQGKSPSTRQGQHLNMAVSIVLPCNGILHSHRTSSSHCPSSGQPCRGSTSLCSSSSRTHQTRLVAVAASAALCCSMSVCLAPSVQFPLSLKPCCQLTITVTHLLPLSLLVRPESLSHSHILADSMWPGKLRPRAVTPPASQQRPAWQQLHAVIRCIVKYRCWCKTC